MSRTDTRNTLLCLLICISAFLATGPIAQMPFEDDWSYAFSARQAALTGRITYNGWATAMILPHTYWGALFIRLFGFSFTVLRFSTLPWAAGSVALCYLLARQADLNPRAAMFVALLLALSPLFLPLATSFMTDVPGLFFVLASLCALLHAGRSGRWPWLFVGAAAGIIGGMNRQVVWIAPLVLLPYLALARRELAFALFAAAAWLVVVGDAVWSTLWFSRQPLAISDAFYPQSVDAMHHPLRTLVLLAPFGLTLMLMVLPAALPKVVAAARELWRGRAQRAGLAAAAVCALLAIFLFFHPQFGLEPWMPIILTPTGVMGSLELSGHRPAAQPPIACGLVAAAVLCAVALLTSRALACASWPRWRRWQDFWLPQNRAIAAPALLLFATAYVLLLIPRADWHWLNDRYALPLIPIGAIFLLLETPTRPLTRCAVSMAASWILLGVFAVYALATTQDLLALARARGDAVQRLSDAGVLPTEIAAGFEYDCWVQLLSTGFINDYRLPVALFKPDVGMTPSLRPLYRVEFEPQRDTIRSSFGVVDYFSAIPPFHRRLFIDQFANPWWTDPARLRTAGHPPPLSFESYY